MIRNPLFIEKSLCTGCGACSQICNKEAIFMQPDEEGFLFPQIDTDKCIGCGLCEKTCPVIHNYSNGLYTQKCFVATTNNNYYSLRSASAGICTMISDSLIKNGAIVFGAYLDENSWTVYHIQVQDKDGLERIRNSKYLQSNTLSTFKEVKRYLNKKINVLYIGTPCQIAGLKCFLHHPYDNLYTIDLICHGVFSSKLMPLEISYWEKLFGSKIENFRFRSKEKYSHANVGMVNFDCVRKDGTRKHVERYAASSPSYHCYAYSNDGKHYNLRMSCYTCKFREKERYGDITVGDPWCIKKGVLKSNFYKDRTNVSLYSVNTEKGDYLRGLIQGFLLEEEVSIQNAFVQPALRKDNLSIPYLRKTFYQNLQQDYGSYVESLFNCHLEQLHENFEKKYRKSIIKRIIKKILLVHLWKRL